MIQRCIHVYCYIIFFLLQSLTASDDNRISKELPSVARNLTITDAVVITESAYHCSPVNQPLAIIFGPLSPCVGTRIHNLSSNLRIDIHISPENCLQDLGRIIEECFGKTNTKHCVSFTLFSRTNEHNCEDWNFKEGSHKARLLAVADTIKQQCEVKSEQIYFHQTNDCQDDVSDRWIVFIGKGIYRFDPYKTGVIKSQSHMESYRERTFREAYKKQAAKVLSSGDISFYRIEKSNLKEINGGGDG